MVTQEKQCLAMCAMTHKMIRRKKMTHTQSDKTHWQRCKEVTKCKADRHELAGNKKKEEITQTAKKEETSNKFVPRRKQET